MAGGNGHDERQGGQPARTPGGGWVPVPDPTVLTTEAVERATQVFRREIQALRETLETRLTAADEDRARIWERLRDLPQLYETFTVHLRDEMFRQDAHDREILVQRLDDLDAARKLATEQFQQVLADTEAQHEHLRKDRDAAITAVREVVEQRLAGMDRALKLMADETARSLATADAGDERTRAETRSAITALRELIEQRLGAMDIATRVLAGNVEKFPTDIDRSAGATREVVLAEIRRVQAVTEERFNAINGTFSSNALALAAALAAQEKAVAAQNDSNTLAISKSESSTKETIAANAAQAQTANASLAAQVTDIKERVVRIESGGAGASASRTEERANRGETHNNLLAVIMAMSVLIAVASLIFALVKKLGSGPWLPCPARCIPR